MTEVQTVGFIGTGLMGFGMAKCLVEKGLEVRVLPHRNHEPARRLESMGARVVSNHRDVADGADGVITCLPNADTAEQVVEKLMPEFTPGMYWIDTTTSRPETSQDIAVRLRAKGAIFADAPVTGGPAQAVEGQLASLVGCDRQHYPMIESVVGIYSKVIRHFGDVGAGNTAKLLNNLVSQGMVILLADAFLCAELKGVDRQALHDVMEAGAVRSGTLEKMVKPYLSGNYDGSQFAIHNSLKDLRYVHELMSEVLPGHSDLSAYLSKRQERQVRAGRGEHFVSNLLKQEFILE